MVDVAVEMLVSNDSLRSTAQPSISLLRMCLWNARAGKNVRPQQQCKETAWLLGFRHTHSFSSSQSRGITYEKGLRDCPHAKFSKIILLYTRNGSPVGEGRTNSRLRSSWLADFALSEVIWNYLERHSMRVNL
jgi:hypothetical protein